MTEPCKCSICGEIYAKEFFKEAKPLLQNDNAHVCYKCSKLVELSRIYSGQCPDAGEIPQQTKKFNNIKSDKRRVKFIMKRYGIKSIEKIKEISDERINIEIKEQKDYYNFLNQYCRN